MFTQKYYREWRWMFIVALSSVILALLVLHNTFHTWDIQVWWDMFWDQVSLLTHQGIPQ